MTPEEQRIAIAKLCPKILVRTLGSGSWVYRHPNGRVLPCIDGDPLQDLNAIQEAIMAQGWGDSEEDDFSMHLLNICDPHRQDDFAFACATAAQRAEALLRATGQWK